jgi:hypothetical protein
MKQQPLLLIATENRLAGLMRADLTGPEGTTLIALSLWYDERDRAPICLQRHAPQHPAITQATQPQ